MSRQAFLLSAALCLCSCSAKTGGAGASCARSTQCESGLVCVEGRCGDDLTSIGEQSEVPILIPDAGGPADAAAGDAAGDAAIDPDLDAGWR